MGISARHGLCRGCDDVRELFDSALISGETVGLCLECASAQPNFVRSASSTARILGADVEDVRHGLRD